MPLTGGENKKGISLKSDNVIFGPYEPLPPLVENSRMMNYFFHLTKATI